VLYYQYINDKKNIQMKYLIFIFSCFFCLNSSLTAQEHLDRPSSKFSLHATYGIFAPVIGARADDWPGGFGSSLRFRILSDNVITIQVGALCNQIKYIAPQGYSSDNTLGNSNLPGKIFDPYLKSNGHPDGIWYPSFKNTMIGADLTAITSLRNVLSKYFQKNTSWDVSIDFGLGFMQKDITLDLLDTNQQPYSNLPTITGAANGVSFDTADGRKAIRESITNTFDNKYETESNIGKLNYLMSTYGLTISKIFARKYVLGINYKTIMYNNNNRVEGFNDRSFNYLATTDEKNVLLSVVFGYHW
jgi:hypothetical protein